MSKQGTEGKNWKINPLKSHYNFKYHWEKTGSVSELSEL